MKIGGKNVSNTLYIGGQRPFTSADKSNLDKNTSARHEHNNKSVLDGITAKKVAQWDAGGSGGGVGGITEEQLKDILSSGIDFLTVKQLLSAYSLHIDGDLGHIVVRDDKGNPLSLKDVFATLATKEELGNINTVLVGKSNELKLLNTYTVDEVLNRIQIIQTDDGINYADLNIRKIQIITVCKKDASQSKNTNTMTDLKFGDTWAWSGSLGAAISNTSDYYSFMEMDLDIRRIVFTATSPMLGYGGNMQISSNLEYPDAQITSASKDGTLPIIGVCWKSTSNDVNIPAGSVIRIWGC